MIDESSSHVVFGLSPLMVATTIFVIAYAAIIVDRVNRAIVALLGAALIIGSGVLNQEQAIHGIDFNTLGLLMGMMVIVGILFFLLEIIGMYLALKLWFAGVLTTGTIVLIQLYIGSIFHGFLHLGKSIARFVKALTEAYEVVEIFETPIEVIDNPNPDIFSIF